MLIFLCLNLRTYYHVIPLLTNDTLKQDIFLRQIYLITYFLTKKQKIQLILCFIVWFDNSSYFSNFNISKMLLALVQTIITNTKTPPKVFQILIAVQFAAPKRAPNNFHLRILCHVTFKSRYFIVWCQFRPIFRYHTKIELVSSDTLSFTSKSK